VLIIGQTLMWVLLFYEGVLICRAVLSWIQLLNPKWTPHGLLLLIAEAIYTLTDPPLRFLRKLIKPLRVGAVQLDMAFMLLFVLVIASMRLVQWVFF